MGRWYVRYGLAAAVVALSVLLRGALIPVIGSGTLYITVYPAMMIVAVTLGAGPGVFGTIVGLVLMEIFFVAPAGEFALSLSLVVRTSILMLTGFYVGRVSQRLRNALARADREARAARTAEERLRLANDDLERRVAEQTAELRQANDTLEQRVVERTGELQAANETLDVSRRAALNLMEDATAVREKAERLLVELAAEKSRWQATVDNMLDLVTVSDAQGKVTYINPAYTRLIERPRAAGLPLERHADYYQLHHPDGTPFPPEDLPLQMAALTGREVREVEILHRAASGREFTGIFSAAPLRDGAGRVIGAVAVGHDVTAQRKAQADAEVGKHLLDTLMENVPDGITIADAPDGRIRMVSRHGQELLGAPHTDLTAPAVAAQWRVYQADGKTAMTDRDLPLMRALRTGEIVRDQELVQVNASGQHLALLCNAAPLRDATGSITGAVVAWRDITARKRAEEALLRHVSRFELLAQIAGELLQAADPQAIVESLCRRVMEYLDCQVFFNFLAFSPAAGSNGEGAGRLHLNAYAGLPPEAARRLEWLDHDVCVCGCVARDGARIVAEHIPASADPGTELVKSFGVKAYACHPLLGEGGAVLGTLSFGTRHRETFSADDLSLMKAVADQVAAAIVRLRARRAIEASAADLARSNHDLEQFAYVASHDLKEPLRMVTAFVGLLKERYGGQMDAKADEYIGFATEGAARMGRLIDDLLTYSRVGRGALREATAAGEQLDAALRNLRAAIEESGATITRDPLPAVSADAGELARVFQNLIGNAIKFRRPGVKPDIHVSARRVADMKACAGMEVPKDGSRGEAEMEQRAAEGAKDEDAMTAGHHSHTSPLPHAHSSPFWLFTVRDNGIGIAPEFAERIFLIFQRLHTNDEYPGTGVGLAICRKIVERHGGRTWVESEPGVGSMFCFTLPGITRKDQEPP